MLKYIIYFIILTSIGMLYDKYKKKYLPSDSERNDKMIQNFLLNDSVMSNSKPIMWIHTSYNMNSRYWPSFYSRNNILESSCGRRCNNTNMFWRMRYM